jgi:serine protease AprX
MANTSQLTPAKRTKVRMKKTFVLFLSAFLTSGLCAGSGKLAKDLEALDPAANVDVIVQFKQAPTEVQHQRVMSRGGVHKKALDLIKGALYSIPANKLKELSEDPDVVYISPDRTVNSTSSTTTTMGLDYFRESMNDLTAQQSGWTGKGVGVAVIDSGITNLGDFSNVVHAESFIGLTSSTSNVDYYGHGTHVAGILSGSGKRSQTGFYTFGGMAPGASLIDLQVLDGTGSGSVSNVIAAIQRAIALQSTYNIGIINLSIGQPVVESYTQDPLCQAVEQAWQAGIVVVVAAGNGGRNNSAGTNGYGTITSPGNDPHVITVGAMRTMDTSTRSDDLIASYSSKGPTLFDQIVKPDIVAPGNQIISTAALPSATLEATYPGNYVPYSTYIQTWSITSPYYFQLSGTSMATPVVSGAAALLLQQNPGMTPDQVKARLMTTASKTFPVSSTAVDPVTGIVYTSYYDLFTIGAGYLDAWAALNGTTTIPAGETAMSPAATYNSSSGQVSLVFGNNVVWGSNVVWGTNVVWGSSVVSGMNVVWGTNPVWASNVVWGSSTLQGFNVVWGSNVVWGTSVPASESASLAVNGDH